MDTDVLIDFGGEIKALGDGKVGGYLVRFTDAATPDLTGDYFSKDTDFGFEDGDPLAIYYNHGADQKLQKRRLGRGTIRTDDAGVWLEAQLELRDDYERAIYAMVESNKAGWSSGSISHLVERTPEKGAYHIKHWPIGEASITPTPAAGPILTAVMPLKAWAEQLAAPEAPSEAARKTATDAERERKALLELELLVIETGV